MKRDYLVVLPVGDDWDASKWLREPEKANWDLGELPWAGSGSVNRDTQLHALQVPADAARLHASLHPLPLGPTSCASLRPLLLLLLAVAIYYGR